MGEVALDRDWSAGPAYVRLRVRASASGWSELGEQLAGLAADRYVLVTDGDVPAELLGRLHRPVVLLREPGTAEHAVRAGATRDSVLIAVGGDRAMAAGAGLAAELGCPFVRVPTSLAAMGHSALSVRIAAPRLVWCQLDALEGESMRAGLVEPIRHVLAVCPGFYPQLLASLDTWRRPRTLATLIALCADARAALTRYDPEERGPGRALNYGRALARRYHGPDAEALGLLATARVAAQLGLLDRAGERAHRALLCRAGLPSVLPAPPELADQWLLLLDDLGEPHAEQGSLLVPVARQVLRAALGAGTVPPARDGQDGSRSGLPARVAGTAGG